MTRIRSRSLVRVVLVLAFVLSTKDPAIADDGASFDAHGTTYGYVFKDGDMDFHFGNLVLGSAGNGGVEIGEAFYAASRITDGDAVSWQHEWFELAKRTEARGTASLAAGHKVSARDQLLRAAYYYRISLISMPPDNPDFRLRGEKARDLMRTAGSLFAPSLDAVEIAFEDTVLPGYFWPAEGEGPHPTLLMIGGGETFAEDLFFYIAPQAHERGYNFMTLDLPGQGLMPLQGQVFRADMHVAMARVVDYALGRPDVDTERLAAFGYSGGGGFVPQAAMHDPRIKAIAMSSAVVDGYPMFAAMPAVTSTPQERAEWSSFHGNVVKSVCWRWGVPMDDPGALVEANRGYTFDPGAITVPALIIIGEGEMRSEEVRRQQDLAMQGFTNPNKKMVVTPANEGATNHCIMENRSIVAQVLFDWLDVTFP